MDPGKMQVHILYFTQTGSVLAAKLARELARVENVTYASGKGCCKEWTAEHFRKGNVLVYIGACGIAVRAVAPHIGSKETDPAVIVIDEKGENVIPILAGHLGGELEGTRRMTRIIGSLKKSAERPSLMRYAVGQDVLKLEDDSHD